MVLSRLQPLPLKEQDISEFIEALRCCVRQAKCRHSRLDRRQRRLPLSSPDAQRPNDGRSKERARQVDLPPFSRKAVLGCPSVTEELRRRLGSRPRFRHRLGASSDWSMTMLRPDPLRVAADLNRVRSAPPKFPAFDNEFSGVAADVERLVSLELQELLAALFPLPSQFERSSNCEGDEVFCV